MRRTALPVQRSRVDAVMRVINEHADQTGKKVMFAFNRHGRSGPDAGHATTMSSQPVERA